MSAESKLYERVCFGPTDPNDLDTRRIWLQARKSGIGASDMGAVLGVSRFGSKLSVYADLLEVEVEVDPTSYGAAYWGTVTAPLVAKAFADANDRRVVLSEELLRSTLRPWQLCTLDAWQAQTGTDVLDGILEIKCTSVYERWDEQIPKSEYIQIQQQFAVTGAEWGSFAVLFNGRDFYYCDVYPDPQMISLINEAGEEFWGQVQRLEEPDADGHPASLEALKKLYPKDDGASIDLPSHFRAIDEERCGVVEQMKKMKSHKDALDAKIKQAIGEASTGCIGEKVSYDYKANKNGVRSLKRKA